MDCVVSWDEITTRFKRCSESDSGSRRPTTSGPDGRRGRRRRRLHPRMPELFMAHRTRRPSKGKDSCVIARFQEEWPSRSAVIAIPRQQLNSLRSFRFSSRRLQETRAQWSATVRKALRVCPMPNSFRRIMLSPIHRGPSAFLMGCFSSV